MNAKDEIKHYKRLFLEYGYLLNKREELDRLLNDGKALPESEKERIRNRILVNEKHITDYSRLVLGIEDETEREVVLNCLVYKGFKKTQQIYHYSQSRLYSMVDNILLKCFVKKD